MAQTQMEGIYESEIVEDLDSIPFPYRNYCGADKCFEVTMPTPKPQLQIYASKGCPFKCKFCMWPQTMYKGNVAKRSPKKVAQEIKENVEKYGYKSVFFDDDTFNIGTERISELCDYLKEIGLEKTTVLINNIGSGESRAKYEEALREYFRPHLDEMCADCKNRFEKNPLRILDCKVDKNTDVMNNAPRIFDYLTEEDKKYFIEICDILTSLGIKYEVSDRLVRGLDYYTNVVFEFIYEDETSPINGLTVLAGGRYNGLSKQLDGPDTEAIGFACGVERLMLALDELGKFDFLNTDALIQVITIGESAKVEGIKLANEIREKGAYVEMDYVSHNLKPQFKLAERCKARYLIIIGEDEVKSGVYKVKDTVEATEQMLTKEEIFKLL